MKCTAILKIPGDRSSAKITSIDEQTVFFNGDEDQAMRMSFCIPPMMGGNVYAHSKGELIEQDGAMLFTIPDCADLDTNVEIEFQSNVVNRVSVVWSD